MANLGDCPANLKQIQHYLKAALEHDSRDVIVAYWCRLYALQTGLKIKNNANPDETKFLIGIMDWLETNKKENHENESITNDVAAQAYLENYAYKLFMAADKMDREENYGKNIVKIFYTAGLIYDVLQTFGELSEEAIKNQKYAKWKAAYIHNCLKNGETPVPGPMKSEDDLEEEDNEAEPNEIPSSSQPEIPSFGFQNPEPSSSSNFEGSDETPSLGEVAKRLPSPPAEPEKSPGGFQPFIPTETNYYQPQPVPIYSGEAANLTPEQVQKAQKYCKWAASALNFDDIKTAIDNLQKGLKLLTTGEDS